MLPSLQQPIQSEGFAARHDAWAAFALVVLASCGTLYAAAWMIARWQLS